ncbi:MAG: hypothetical protein ABIF11_04495 [Nitrospirota bacterium]
MKKIIMSIVSIILVVGIIFGISSCIKKKDDNIPKLKTAVVQRGDMVVKVTETGSVQPKLLSRLSQM